MYANKEFGTSLGISLVVHVLLLLLIFILSLFTPPKEETYIEITLIPSSVTSKGGSVVQPKEKEKSAVAASTQERTRTTPKKVEGGQERESTAKVRTTESGRQAEARLSEQKPDVKTEQAKTESVPQIAKVEEKIEIRTSDEAQTPAEVESPSTERVPDKPTEKKMEMEDASLSEAQTERQVVEDEAVIKDFLAAQREDPKVSKLISELEGGRTVGGEVAERLGMKGGTSDIEGQVRGRKLLFRSDPEYPEWAREEGLPLNAKVKVKFWVTPEGIVRKVETVEASGYRKLDTHTENKIKTWRWEPISPHIGDQWGAITVLYRAE
ncbi:MAG: TonB family protein [bacterium]